MPELSEISRYYRVSRHDLAYLKFIVEAYEGLATLSTVERESGTVVVTYSSHFAEDVTNLMDALGTEIAIQEVPGMEVYPHA